MESVKWGVLGVANHFVKRVLLPLKKSPIINLYGIASRSKDRAEMAAKKFNIPRAYGSYEELLADKEIEAVYIPLPNNLHGEWIKKSADAGKHIICEKPLALSAEEAKESIEYAKSRGVKLMEAFMYQLHPQWQRAKELVSVGEIGEVHTIHTRFFYYLIDPTNIRNRLETGGGALRDIGCYAISIARFLLDQEPKRVISLLTRDQDFKTDILTSAILDFGMSRSLFTVSTQTFPHQCVYVHGEGGTIHIKIPFNMYPDVPAEVVVTTDIGTRVIRSEPADQYELEFEAFSKAIRGEAPIPISSSDTINNQKVIDAAFKSEQTGTWVDIE